MGTVLKVTLGILLAGVLLVGGCVAVIGAGVNEADKEQKKQGITQAEFDAQESGTRQAKVEQALGKPEDAQAFESEIPDFEGGTTNEKSSCIYYPEKGKGIGEGKSFQLCFTNGKLDSKNVY